MIAGLPCLPYSATTIVFAPHLVSSSLILSLFLSFSATKKTPTHRHCSFTPPLSCAINRLANVPVKLCHQSPIPVPVLYCTSRVHMYACMYAYVLESSPFYYARFWLAHAVLQLAGPTAHTAHGRLSFPSLSLCLGRIAVPSNLPVSS